MPLTLVALSGRIVDFSAFVYRAADPTAIDIVLGIVTILLVLEATRRPSAGSCRSPRSASSLYALGGPAVRSHRPVADRASRLRLDRLVGTLYMTLEGIFGVPLDVAATYIILFTIYGAVLEQSGAGRFFIDWAMAAMRTIAARAPAPGRTVTSPAFCSGTVSGSGVATTVMLGSVAWPLLRRAGYGRRRPARSSRPPASARSLSPPTLGAAAFLIAEFLQISYLQVLVMATHPDAALLPVDLPDDRG